MNTISLQIFSILGVSVYFILIIYFLKRKSLSIKYTLVWIVLGLCMAILAFFPNTLVQISIVLGIESPVNALFAILIFLALTIMISLTAIVSKQTMRIRTLVQEVALLEKRIRDIEHTKLE